MLSIAFNTAGDRLCRASTDPTGKENFGDCVVKTSGGSGTVVEQDKNR